MLLVISMAFLERFTKKGCKKQINENSAEQKK